MKYTIQQRLSLWCGIVGPFLFTVIYTVDGAFHLRYNWLREPISSLNSLSNGWIQDGNFILFALFLIIYSFGLRKAFKSGITRTVVVSLQIIDAIGLLISGFFIHDPLHTLGDITTFMSMMIICFIMAKLFTTLPNWRGWTIYSIITAILMVICLILFGMSMKTHGLSGFYERIAILLPSVWSILFTWRLLHGIKLWKE